jgi:hypothetical protein
MSAVVCAMLAAWQAYVFVVDGNPYALASAVFCALMTLVATAREVG